MAVPNANDPSTLVSQLSDFAQDQATIVTNAIRDIQSVLTKEFERVLKKSSSLSGGIKKTQTDVLRSLSQMVKYGDKVLKNQQLLAVGTLKERDIRHQINEVNAQYLIIETKLKNLVSEKIIKQQQYDLLIEDAKLTQTELLNILNKQAKVAEKTRSSMGILGAFMKGLSKIPVLGGVIDSEKILFKIQEAGAKTNATRWSVFATGIKEIGKSITRNISDPISILTFAFTQAFKIDKQATEFAKSLVKTKEEGKAVRTGFEEMNRSINDSFITTDKLVEANMELGKQLGFNKVFSKDMLVTFIDLTKKMGLSVEAAGFLTKSSILSGKSVKETKEEFLQQAQAVSSAYGIQLDNKEVLEEVSKISGQILANFRGNPLELVKAVATAKMLGTSLDVVKGQIESLLNFESSIENELKAELLLGQTLNLERARAAALQGDYLTVMKELNSQGVTWSDFTHMNVLQQKALAETLGLSTDQLSNQLLKQEYLGKSRSEILALGGKEVADRMEILSTQEKFNAAMEKLQGIVGDLVEGPFGKLLSFTAKILSNTIAVNGIAAIYTGILIRNLAMKTAEFFLQKKISRAIAAGATAEAAKGQLGIPVIGLALGLAAAGIVATYLATQMNKGDDIMSPGYGKRTLLSPEGAIALNDKDTVIAGTKLFDKKDNEVKPKKSISEIIHNNNIIKNNNSKNITHNHTNELDLSQLVKAINTVKSSVDKLYDKEGIVTMDGRKVGTALVQSSYKVA